LTIDWYKNTIKTTQERKKTNKIYHYHTISYQSTVLNTIIRVYKRREVMREGR